TGPRDPIEYPLSWTGNDGTFQSVGKIRLPLAQSVPLRIDIGIASSGVHSAILNLHDPKTGAIILRTAATVYAPERFLADGAAIQCSGSVPLMSSKVHVFSVPPDTAAVRLDMSVVSGTPSIRLVSPTGLTSGYYPNSEPPGLHRMLSK